jgi:hypothetical protein
MSPEGIVAEGLAATLGSPIPAGRARVLGLFLNVLLDPQHRH